MLLDFLSVFRSFSHKNYRYFFIGQNVSLIGTWMQATALGWLVYRLTNSSSMLGITGFVNLISPLIFGYFAGVLSDRIERKKALFFTQTMAMLLAGLLAFLTLSERIKIWHIFAISFLAGIVGSFDMPIRQSFVVEMVGKDDLSNALALNSVMFNLSRIIGPAIAGFIIHYLNEGYCFLFNFLSYLAIIYALYLIKPYPIEKEKKTENIYSSFKSGLKYIWKTPYIKYPLSFLMLLSFVVMPVINLLPVFVKNIGGDSKTLGFFMSSIGFGAVISGLDMAKRKENKSLTLMVSNFSILYGLSLIIISFPKIPILNSIFLIMAGMGTTKQAVGINTLIQSVVNENMRGRVVSIYAMSFMGLAPFGNIFWGYLADKIGINTTIMFCGIWVILANIWFLNKMSKFKKLLLLQKDYEFSEYQNLKNIL